MTTSDMQAKPARKLNIVLLMCWLALLAIGLGGSYMGYTQARAAAANYDPPQMFQPVVAPKQSPQPSAEPVAQVPDWQGNERINILLMGIDQREDEEGPWRTDTMILASVDPVANSASMLSVPRDLWVTIPGYQEDRINNAHFYGDAYGYPGGGPALAKKTLQHFLGVPVHYYVRVNFTAFEKLVDLIGGIDVVVEREISDPEYPARTGYGFDPLYIPAGKQHLDGALALKYARFRHDDQGDFGRAHRQQQVILAVRDRVLRADKLPELLSKAPQLVATLGDAVQTDLTLDQALQLAKLGMRIKDGDVTGEVIDETMVLFSTTPDGQQVLIPMRDEVRKLRDRLYVSVQAGDAALPEQQTPRVMVLNGTLHAGMASQTAETLSNQGFRVTDFGNAERFDYTQTIILDYSQSQVGTQLATALGVPESAVQVGEGRPGDYDVQVILGADYAAQLGLPPLVGPTAGPAVGLTETPPPPSYSPTPAPTTASP